MHIQILDDGTNIFRFPFDNISSTCVQYSHMYSDSFLCVCFQGTRPTNDISIEFEIRWKFKTL